MVQRARIPILLLTGFLGSGKTSLLANWLRSPEFKGAMAIVNELGEVGLDDRLAQFSSDAPVLLENGCACCEAAEDLNATLERLFWQRLHRQIPRFEWVLIETTGIADPAPIVAAIANNEIIAERYKIAGVVTVFDARRGPEQIAQHPECRSQLRHADAVALSKTDIASEAEISAAQAEVERLRPGAALYRSVKGDLSATIIIEALASAAQRERSAPEEQSPEAQHSPDVTSAFAPLAGPVAWKELDEALALAMKRYGKRILRLKGIVEVDRAGQAEAIQASPGEPIERTPLPAETRAGRTGFTIISQFVPAELIARDFLSMLLLDEQTPAAMPAFPQRARG